MGNDVVRDLVLSFSSFFPSSEDSSAAVFSRVLSDGGDVQFFDLESGESNNSLDVSSAWEGLSSTEFTTNMAPFDGLVVWVGEEEEPPIEEEKPPTLAIAAVKL